MVDLAVIFLLLQFGVPRLILQLQFGVPRLILQLQFGVPRLIHAGCVVCLIRGVS